MTEPWAWLLVAGISFLALASAGAYRSESRREKGLRMPHPGEQTRTQRLRLLTVTCALCKKNPVWGEGPYCQQCEGWEIAES